MTEVGVIGGSGYIGSELLRILVTHPEVSLSFVTSRSYQGTKICKIHPNLSGFTELNFIGEIGEADVFLVSLPHGESMKVVPELVECGYKVIDLSGDYRLKNTETYESWYGIKHTSPDLIEKAVFGLPEYYRTQIKHATLVSSPGCFPTGALLALGPLVENLPVTNIVIDSKTGSSGSGKDPSFYTHHPERNNDIRAYSLTNHRHIPEIEQALFDITDKELSISFTPHSLPIIRGIFTTAHVFTESEVTQNSLINFYHSKYEKEPFVRVKEKEEGKGKESPRLASVIHSNFCEVYAEFDKRTKRVTALSAIDNLIKGGSGQAIQCMNLMLGLNETTGLFYPGFHP